MTDTQCSVAACTNPARTRGLCNGHRQQLARGAELTPLQVPVTTRDELGRKWCPSCSSWLDPELFCRTARAKDGLKGHCRDCTQYRAALKRYNMTEDQFRSRMADQGNACEICGAGFTRQGSWHVDHDHGCCPRSSESCGKCIRGFLCGNCNRGIGCLGDDAARLRKAAAYLER